MRCPALSRGLSRAVPRCPALSRAPFSPAHALSPAVPRFPAPHFYQHMRCPALSRAPFLPAHARSRAFPRLTSTRHVADNFQVAMGATQGRLENCILQGSQLGTALYIYIYIYIYRSISIVDRTGQPVAEPANSSSNRQTRALFVRARFEPEVGTGGTSPHH